MTVFQENFIFKSKPKKKEKADGSPLGHSVLTSSLEDGHIFWFVYFFVCLVILDGILDIVSKASWRF